MKEAKEALQAAFEPFDKEEKSVIVNVAGVILIVAIIVLGFIFAVKDLF